MTSVLKVSTAALVRMQILQTLQIELYIPFSLPLMHCSTLKSLARNGPLALWPGLCAANLIVERVKAGLRNDRAEGSADSADRRLMLIGRPDSCPPRAELGSSEATEVPKTERSQRLSRIDAAQLDLRPRYSVDASSGK